jgi:predicted Ser/Thr protein kinase
MAYRPRTDVGENLIPAPAADDDLFQIIESLKEHLIAFSTDRTSDLTEDGYKRSRKVILGLGEGTPVPEFLRECRTLAEFWEYIKAKCGTYAERRRFIATALNRVLDGLEEHGTLGRHLEERETIGEGGFGIVYRYRHTLLEMDFAVKVFAPSFSQGGEGHLERFFREARILFRMTHPNIVRVYDVGMLGKRPYIRMEFVPGRSLQAVLNDRGPIRPWHAATVITEVADALAYAHNEARVVHRDLKPGNVLVFRGPNKVVNVRVIDFGLGVFVEQDLVSRITRAGEGVVAGHFTAPELSADPLLLDTRSDLYSLGAVWYNLITGRPPSGVQAADALERVDGLTTEHKELLLRCLADVDHRISSAAELRDQLRKLASIQRNR